MAATQVVYTFTPSAGSSTPIALTLQSGALPAGVAVLPLNVYVNQIRSDDHVKVAYILTLTGVVDLDVTMDVLYTQGSNGRGSHCRVGKEFLTALQATTADLVQGAFYLFEPTYNPLYPVRLTLTFTPV